MPERETVRVITDTPYTEYTGMFTEEDSAVQMVREIELLRGRYSFDTHIHESEILLREIEGGGEGMEHVFEIGDKVILDVASRFHNQAPNGRVGIVTSIRVNGEGWVRVKWEQREGYNVREDVYPSEDLILTSEVDNPIGFEAGDVVILRKDSMYYDQCEGHTGVLISIDTDDWCKIKWSHNNNTDGYPMQDVILLERNTREYKFKVVPGQVLRLSNNRTGIVLPTHKEVSRMLIDKQQPTSVISNRMSARVLLLERGTQTDVYPVEVIEITEAFVDVSVYEAKGAYCYITKDNKDNSLLAAAMRDGSKINYIGTFDVDTSIQMLQLYDN